MRLAVFTSKYPARVSTFFERDMRALIEAGVEIDILPLLPLDAGLWRYGLDILNERVLPRSRVHHLSLPASLWRARPWRGAGTVVRAAAAISASAVRYGPLPLLKSLYVLPKAWAWAAERADQYDHILAYWGNYAGTSAYLFHRLIGRRIPLTLWLHAGTDLYRHQVYLSEKLRYADGIVTCCDFNRSYMIERYGDSVPGLAERIHVCYHGLDLAHFRFQPDGRPAARIVAVGRLAKHKGFDYLLRAARLLRDRGRRVEVVLVGDGGEQQNLTALAAELGIADAVRFTGWLSFADVQRAMTDATMLVHPSPGLGDGLPNVLREAMALGTPVIASDVAGIPEALDRGRCGLLVPPGDVGALADAVARLLDDADLRRTFATRGRQRTETEFDMWSNGARLADRLRRTPAAARC